MSVKKSLVVISSVLTGVFLLGSIIYASHTNVEQKEVVATNVGDETYRTFLLSTNDKVTVDEMNISFDNFATSSKMTLIQDASSKMKLFAVRVPSSSVSSQVYFRNDSHSVRGNTPATDSTNYYVMNGSSTASSITNNIGKLNHYVPSAYTTRRVWITLSKDVNGFLGLFGSDYRYMFNEFINSEDSRTYYYVDIPYNLNNFNISYVNGDCSGNNIIIARNTFSNSTMHRINYIDVDKQTISQYDPVGLDQYFINEYLKGFSTCLGSDINGYEAYDPYIVNMMSYYHLDASLLNDVYQDDYLKSDYDDGYQATSIRGGYIVSASSKLAELHSHYDEHHSRVMTLNDNDASNNNILFVVIFSIIAISGLALYPIYRISKHH